MIKNNYKENIKISYGTTGPSFGTGIEVPFLDSLDEPGCTILSKQLNSWIFNIIKKYDKVFAFDEIIHLYDSNIGAFLTLNRKWLTHVRWDLLKYAKDLLNCKKDKGRLFLLDYSTFFDSVTKPIESIKCILESIQEGDKAFTCCPSSHFRDSDFNIREILKLSGLSVKAIFCFGNRSKIYSERIDEIDAITPLGLTFEGEEFYLVLFDREKVRQEFVCEFDLYDQKTIDSVVNSFIAGKNGDDIRAGLFLDNGHYCGSRHWASITRLGGIERELSSQSLVAIGDLIDEIDSNPVSLSENFEKDCVGFILIAMSVWQPEFYLYPEFPIAVDVMKFKNNPLYSMKLNKDLIDHRFFIYLFRSKIGTEIFQLSRARHAEITDTFLDWVVWFKNIRIPVPTLDTQINIIDSLCLVDEVKSRVQSVDIDFRNCLLSDNGKYAPLDKLHNIIEIFNGLSSYEKIKKAIYSGESKTTEFKETFSLDVRNNGTEKAKHIEDECIKTIAAFLNSDGGILLVGVRDDGALLGVDGEIEKFHKSADKFLLHFKNILKNKIGAQYYPFFDYQLVECEGKTILEVNCNPASQPIYVDEKDFYVRTNPATDRLEGKKVLEYVANHPLFSSHLK